jgi:hypothetical protein
VATFRRNKVPVTNLLELRTFSNGSGEFIGPSILTPGDSHHTEVLAEIAKYEGRPQVDAYASVYYSLVMSFKNFLHYRKKSCLSVQLYAVLYETLPSTLGYSKDLHANGINFDRIAVSNLVDSELLGFEKTASIFALMLKPRAENPHAALIALHTTALTNDSAPKPTIEEDFQALIKSIKANSARPEDIERAARNDRA